MEDKFLYEKLEVLREAGVEMEIPEVIPEGLSRKIVLREYQIHAFKNFLGYYENKNLRKNRQVHALFHMATGSGKTVIMAGLILYLYTKGYRKFLFFVNQTNVLEKTIDNFTNMLSNKYLFHETIEISGNEVKVRKVENFSGSPLQNEIEIVFTTTQKLHLDLFEAKENSLTYEDFESNKVVFISDESHHINSLTKKPTKDEQEAAKSWEYSVMKAFQGNKESVMLEFTATCDIKDENVREKYRDKIVFNYPLISFRESGYTKDFQNFATDTDFWTRTLMALVMSEYRRFLFADLKWNIKPVVMLKFQRIADSEKFYQEFFHRIKELRGYELEKLELVGIDSLAEAIRYFREKEDTLEILETSIKNSFSVNTAIIMNGASENNRENQLLVNSLEDLDNPIRIIFAVDMLNEGWDVLNLFDIVRLYDTRQANTKGRKVGSYTIKEAQLIGRGARYCPFVIGDEEDKYKRKYDGDLSNKNRILETMYFHSKNDSRYISELKQALVETGLQDSDSITLEYRLKEGFKESEFFKKGFVYSNKRLPRERKEVTEIESSLRNKTYYYTVLSGKGKVYDLVGELNNKTFKTKVKCVKFKDIDLNILLGAIDFFDELKFEILKEKYPVLTSKKEFLISDQFLGNSRLEITYSEEEVTGRDLFLALKHALGKVASHIMSLKSEYIGSREFTPRKLSDVLKDKRTYLGKVDHGGGGKGESQNYCTKEEYRLDLQNEDWYVFQDNYGTGEEKMFLKYFKMAIEPKLKEKGLEYYVIRNERIPELAIYSFETGERFEPDFLIFIRKKTEKGDIIYQGYVEVKGSHLIEEDSWKEDFSLQIRENHRIAGLHSASYQVVGFPFFNKEHRMDFFEKEMDKFMEMIG